MFEKKSNLGSAEISFLRGGLISVVLKNAYNKEFQESNDAHLLPTAILYLYKVRWLINHNEASVDYYKRLKEQLLESRDSEYRLMDNALLANCMRVRPDQKYIITCKHSRKKGYLLNNKTDPTASDDEIVETAFIFIWKLLMETKDKYKIIFFNVLDKIDEKLQLSEYINLKNYVENTFQINTILNQYIQVGNFNYISYNINAQQLIKYDIINIQKPTSYSNVFEAIKYNDLEALEKFLELRTNINELDLDGNTLLHHACLFKHKDIIQYLICKHIDVNHLNNKKENCLYFLTNTEILLITVSKLLTHVCLTEEGAEIFKYYSESPYFEIYDILVNAGVNIKQKNNEDKMFWEFNDDEFTKKFKISIQEKMNC